MREIGALGINILTPRKQIKLTAFTPLIVLPLYDKAKGRLPPAANTMTTTAIGACLNAEVQGTRLLEPHSVSAIKFNVDGKHVPLCDLVLESDDGDGRFVSVATGGHKVVVEGGFVLPVADESDDPDELKSTACFSVSTTGDEGDNDE